MQNEFGYQHKLLLLDDVEEDETHCMFAAGGNCLSSQPRAPIKEPTLSSRGGAQNGGLGGTRLHLRLQSDQRLPGSNLRPSNSTSNLRLLPRTSRPNQVLPHLRAIHVLFFPRTSISAPLKRSPGRLPSHHFSMVCSRARSRVKPHPS